MLRAFLIGLAAVAVAAAAPGALAQQQADEQHADVDVPRLPGLAAELAPEEMRRLQNIARQISEQAQQSLRNATPEQTNIAAGAKRRIDSIADEGLARERDEVLRFLGLNPEDDSALYVFVSWSMPLEMLRAYAVEAMWSGATLVFKGVPRGRDLGDYIREDLAKLVYGKGAAASISIDPRLFDAYRVAAVPAIVLTESKDAVVCMGRQRRVDAPGAEKGAGISYQVCEPSAPDTYHKISGAVTLDFALSEFKKAGSKSAELHLRALAQAYAGAGTARPKHIQPYRGEWKDAVSPSDIMAARAAVDAAEGVARQRPR